MPRASQSRAILFRDNLGDFRIHFHPSMEWKWNFSYIFTKKSCTNLKSSFFNSNSSLCLIFSPEMTRKSALNLRNQKILSKSLSPQWQYVHTQVYTQTHAKQQNGGAAAFPSQGNIIWLLWSTLPLTARRQTLATFWKWVQDHAPGGSNFLVSKYQSS